MSVEQIEAWLDGDLPPAEQEDWESWISEDEEHCLQLLQEAALQEELRLLHRQPRTLIWPVDEPVEPRGEQRVVSTRPRWPVFFGIAASLLVAATLAVWQWPDPVVDPNGVANRPMPLNPDDPSSSRSGEPRAITVVQGPVRLPARQYSDLSDPALTIAEIDDGNGLVQWGDDLQLALGPKTRILLASTTDRANGGTITLQRGSVEIRPMVSQEPTSVVFPLKVVTEAGDILARGSRLTVAVVQDPAGKSVSVSVASGEATVQGNRAMEGQTILVGEPVLLKSP